MPRRTQPLPAGEAGGGPTRRVSPCSRRRAHESNERRPEVSVVMPCLNEEAAIGACIEKIQRTFDQAGARTARSSCATTAPPTLGRDRGVAWAPGWCTSRERGYGNAYLKGFDAARGTLSRHGRCRRYLRLHPDPPASWRRCGRTATPSSPAAAISAAATAHHGPAPLVRQPGAHPYPQPALRHPLHRRVLRLSGLLPRRRTSGSGR